MRTLVIMPGGFHPFHAGHASLYQDAVKAFPGADVYVTASNDTSERSFPFVIKEKLARVAGVPAGRFVQVKSPFTSEEITSRYDPDDTILIFVKSEKNSKNGSDPEGPFPAEVDPATGKLPLAKKGKRKGLPISDTLKYYAGNEKNLQPMSRNRYIAYLPTVPFGPGIKSGSEFRVLWDKFTKVLLNPKSTPEQKEKAQTLKTEFVKNMYPATQGNSRLAVNVVKLIDKGMSSPLTNKSDLAEGSLNEFVPPSNDGGGENDRNRRIRKLLEIAIQVAKEKNVDELGMIHAMNMIAGDDFFSVAVEGILPDITDKEYMFVLQSAYKTVKQGVAEGLKQTLRKFDPTIKARIRQKSQDQTNQGIDTIQHLADLDLTSDDMVSRAMKPNTYFKNAERYAKLANKGVAEGSDDIEDTRQFRDAIALTKSQKAIRQARYGKDQKFYADGTPVTPEEVARRAAERRAKKQGLAEAEKTAKVFHPQFVDVYFLEGSRREPILVNRKVPYKLIDKYLEVVTKKYNLPQGRFEFRNAEELVDEDWKTKFGAAALTGAMALGASGSHAADIASPTFNGMQTISHNDGSNTTKYNSGPLSMQSTKNKQGKTTSLQRNYQIGDTNVGVGTNAVGVNTLTATGDQADNWLGVGPSANRLKVSPDKIKAFQQGVKESSFKKINVSKNQDYLEEK